MTAPSGSPVGRISTRPREVCQVLGDLCFDPAEVCGSLGDLEHMRQALGSRGLEPPRGQRLYWMSDAPHESVPLKIRIASIFASWPAPCLCGIRNMSKHSTENPFVKPDPSITRIVDTDKFEDFPLVAELVLYTTLLESRSFFSNSWDLWDGLGMLCMEVVRLKLRPQSWMAYCLSSRPYPTHFNGWSAPTQVMREKPWKMVGQSVTICHPKMVI